MDRQTERTPPPRGVLKIFGSERDTALLVIPGLFFVIVVMGMAIAFLGPLIGK